MRWLLVEWDTDANLYYYRNRWYDPQEGRFISEDPIGLKGGINPYAYVENNSLKFIDPMGTQGLSYTQPTEGPG
jgi:RHS repeat-associated protein